MSPTILILDRDETLCEELMTGLLGAGYQARSGLDALEGMKLIEDREYDLVLLGLDLPEGEESELLRAIKKKGRRTRVLVLGGVHFSRPPERPLKDGFLSRPIVIPTLLEKVRELISQGAGAGSRKSEVLHPGGKLGAGNEY